MSFKIQPRLLRGAQPTLTLRCERDLYERVNKAAEDNGCSTSEFIRQAVEYALSEMEAS